MPVVFSEGTLQSVRASAGGLVPPTGQTGIAVVAGDPIWLHTDYAAIYRSHPFIRCCVDFLSRNVAQLGIHLYRREKDGGRTRERDHPVAKLLDSPNEITARYDFVCSTVADLGIYGVAYWLKWGPPGSRSALIRIPPTQLTALEHGFMSPTRYELTIDNTRVPLSASDVIRFRWFDPDPSRSGLAPIESLRRIVAEDRAAALHRTTLWQTGARIGGVIERPKEAGIWSPEARDRFKTSWSERYSGPASVGQVPVLEDGMSFRPVTMSLADTQASDMRVANLEDIARVFQIPAPMVGLLEHATYSNVKEQHKHFLADCLGPICTQIEDTLAVSLLAEWEDVSSLYLEFNLAEKLKGSFEDQARALQSLQYVMTLNEQRAVLNLPAVPGGDTVAQPLNVSPLGDAPPPPVEEHAPRGESAGVVH